MKEFSLLLACCVVHWHRVLDGENEANIVESSKRCSDGICGFDREMKWMIEIEISRWVITEYVMR